MKSVGKAGLAEKARPISLSEALEAIKPKRSDEACLALTVCCLYLQTGLPMPRELRLWLDKYLTSERRQIRGTRGLRMANLEVMLNTTRQSIEMSGKGKITRTQAEYAAALGIDESTVKKWRRRRTYAATVALSAHLNELLNVVMGKSSH